MCEMEVEYIFVPSSNKANVQVKLWTETWESKRKIQRDNIYVILCTLIWEHTV